MSMPRRFLGVHGGMPHFPRMNAVSGDVTCMKSSKLQIRKSASVPTIIALLVSAFASLSLTPFSSAQTNPSNPGAPTTADKAALGQASLPESSLSDREAALRQAEDDLLRKLNGSAPATSETQSDTDGRNSFIIGSDASVTAPTPASGAVLSERLSPDAPIVTNTTTTTQPKPLTPEVAPSLLNCPPCAVQASSRTVSQRSSSSSTRRTPSQSAKSTSSSSARMQREDSILSGPSGGCDRSIDDPYVPTSEKARITASRTHLRLGPSRTESSLFVLPKDAIVSIEGRDGEWYRVMTTTGVRGWVSGQYLIFDYDVPESSSVRVGPYNASYEPTGIKY